MATNKKTATRGKKGNVHIQQKPNGMLLRWTFNGKRYSEKFTTQERFEEIKYLLKVGQNPKKEKAVSNIDDSDLTCESLLDAWIALKASEVQQTTLDNYNCIKNTALAQMDPYHPVNDAKEIIRFCRTHLSKSTGKRFLMYLNSACWEYLNCRPYSKAVAAIKEDWQTDPNPRALTEAERASILPMLPRSHALTARLALCTGMRPSELYGLQWGDLDFSLFVPTPENPNGIPNRIFGHITIQRQCREVSSGIKIKDGLKTQKSRKFPVNGELYALLKEIKLFQGAAFDHNDESIVMKWILGIGDIKCRYTNFLYYWRKYAPKETTLYNCRDTFITEQLLKGTPASVVAAWVGNSTQVIEKHYLDRLAVLNYCP